MKESISITEAVERIWKIAVEKRIAGESIQTRRELDAVGLPSQVISKGFSMRWERGWAVDARLSVDTTVANGAIVVRVHVAWSSSELTASSARAAATLHAEVADLACWMQSAIDSLPAIDPKK